MAEMEFEMPFVVEIKDELYLIMPLYDETFDVFKSDGMLLGNIYPEIGIDRKLTWSTSDLIPLEDVSALGLAIERKEM